jgi:hypothetical protein
MLSQTALRWTRPAVCAVAALTVAGCTGNDAAPPATSSATATPLASTAGQSPTPTVDLTTEPARPAALDGSPSKEAAVAFARYFLALHDYAYHSGDTSTFSSVSDPACIYCSDTVADVKDELGKGYVERGGGTKTSNAGALETVHGRSFKVQLDATLAPYVVQDRLGKVVHTLSRPQTYHLDFAIRFDGDWTVADVASVMTGEK